MLKATTRIDFIDTARIYGVALVYYGHFIESYMKAGSAIAAHHYKFIYSFHMPLFFILSGFIAKDLVTRRGFFRFLAKLSAQRLLPYLFFSLLLILPTFFTTDNTVGLNLPSLAGYGKGLVATLLAGFPYFNVPIWFLICLFMVELIHYPVSRYLKNSPNILAAAFLFYCLGSGLAWHAGFLNPLNLLAHHGKIYPYFMILEAFTGYSFYLLGIYLRQEQFLLRPISTRKSLGAGLICLFLVYLSYDLNKGMFTFPYYDAVVLLASSHGNPILFPVTAILGSLAILFFAKATPRGKSLPFLGRNALIIFGLNGIYYHLVNDRLAIWLLSFQENTPIFITATGLLVALLSLGLSLPFIFLLNATIPQLLGKPRQQGPLLPRLL